MKCQLFTVFDGAADRFLEPFYAPTVEYALRQFRTTVNTPDHHFNRYPEDYTLFHVGEFDQEIGTIESFPTPRSLGVAVTFVDQASYRDLKEASRGEKSLKAVNDA